MKRFHLFGLAVLVLLLGPAARAAEPDAAPTEAEKPAPAKPAADEPAAPDPDDLVALVKEVEGTVETRPAVGRKWVPVKTGMKLVQGADLRTGFRARCVLDMVDSLVQVDPLTVVRLGELSRREGTVRTRLILKQGHTAAIVEKERIESDFAIVTPSATLSVRGTKDAWAGFFPDTGGSYGLGGPGLVGVRNHLLGKETLCRPGQKTNDQIQKPIKVLQKKFLPVNLPTGGLGNKETFAAARWKTSNPLPAGLQGPGGPPNTTGKNQGQQKDPDLPDLPVVPNGCQGERRDITPPPQ
ncbi:MAG: hypothetical protein R6X20_07000 [Phycisphaerae bacterium]